MEQETIAQKAKRLLSPIPKENWTDKHGYTDNISRCCFLGHWNRLNSGYPEDYSDRNCAFSVHTDEITKPIGEYIKKVVPERYMGTYTVAAINDTDVVNGYTEDNPKDRCMHLLDDLIAAGY